jgi:hypothetical protein
MRPNSARKIQTLEESGAAALSQGRSAAEGKGDRGNRDSGGDCGSVHHGRIFLKQVAGSS